MKGIFVYSFDVATKMWQQAEEGQVARYQWYTDVFHFCDIIPVSIIFPKRVVISVEFLISHI